MKRINGRSKTWWIKFPKDAYGLGPVWFDKPVTEREVREYVRKFDGCKRLPAGFECWKGPMR